MDVLVSTNIDAHNTIFNGIVDGKHDTEVDLEALGLPKHFARYAGRTRWNEPAAHLDDAYADYKDKSTSATSLVLPQPPRPQPAAAATRLPRNAPRPGRLPRQLCRRLRPAAAHLEHRVPFVSTA
jgi:hypothetical protein